MDLNTEGDQHIIVPIRKGGAGEDEAIRALYRQHYTQLSGYVLNNSGSEQDADDIFQETIIAFVQSVKTNKFRGESSVGTFLYALCRNIWRNEMRRRGRMQTRELHYGSSEDREDEGVGKVLEMRQATSKLMALVDELGESCKKILLQFYYEGRSMKEIVSTLSYENEQVVRNKKSKCLKKLSEILRNQPQSLEDLKTLLHE